MVAYEYNKEYVVNMMNYFQNLINFEKKNKKKTDNKKKKIEIKKKELIKKKETKK